MRHNCQKIFPVETTSGVVCELKHAPLEAVGLYIPGGSAPLPSTVLMLGVPAQLAGCRRVVLVTPPGQPLAGDIAPEIIYAAQLCGIREIYTVGGAQAIAALAYGTDTIAKVDKIYGPGNRYVTEAKQQVSRDPMAAAIDMPAGPSEVLVIADETATASFVAADLLSQAEHGVDS
ncbi:MAG: histidinol dehydrogenase [Rheinheimera sp.]|nr:histidinol dehydrogenase [Rheinheimera sp.]